MLNPYYRRVLLHTLLSLSTAALLLIAMPRFDQRWLAPFVLVPLLIAVGHTANTAQRFLYGWAAGIFYWAFLCTWIQFVLAVHGGVGELGGWACFILFALYKGLHLGVFSALAGPLLNRS